MSLSWIANTSAGRFVGDYISTSFTAAGTAYPVIEVANGSLLAAAERLADVFGPVEARVAGTRIAGIDIVVTLGTDYVATLDPSAAAGTTAADGSSAGDTVVVGSSDTTVEGTS